MNDRLVGAVDAGRDDGLDSELIRTKVGRLVG